MSDKTDNNSLIHVERSHGLQNEIKQQAQVIGALQQNISHLEGQIAEGAKKVIIEERNTKRKGIDCYGDLTYTTGTKITKVNMEEAAELIAERVNEDNEAELKVAKETISAHERDIERHEQAIKNHKASHARNRDTILAETQEQEHQIKKSYEDSNVKLKHKVEELKDELLKTKKDKTDEKVELERKQEVSKLKARVKGLEREVKRLATQGWLGKSWDRISNRKPRIEALKQVEEEAALAPIVARGGLFNMHLPGPFSWSM